MWGKRDFTVAIRPAPTAGLRVVNSGQPNGTVGIQFATVTYTPYLDPAEPFTVTQPVHVAAGALPPGLTLDSSAPGGAGRLSGTPTKAGTYPFTLAWSSNLSVGEFRQDFTITVARAPGEPTDGLSGKPGPVVAGGGAGGAVIFRTVPEQTFHPFGAVSAGVRVVQEHLGTNLNNLFADVIAVTGPGTPVRVVVYWSGGGAFNDVTGPSRPLVAPFDPFGGDFTGGGFLSTADFDGDGLAEIVVTPDQGGGPRVVIYSMVNGGPPVLRASFLGIDDPNFRGGARTATGDVNGDGTPDLIVAAGFGGGPRIAVYDGKTLFSGAPVRLVNDFLAFELNLRNGVYVSAGDLDGDGYADLVFGGGPGGGPRVLVAGGKQLMSGGAVAALAAPLANFFSGPADGNRGGVPVAVKGGQRDLPGHRDGGGPAVPGPDVPRSGCCRGGC